MQALTLKRVHYPDSDGLPMSDNTLQFRWIVTIKENLDAMLPDFVGGDLLWYPVEGDNKTRLAPDALVALGRPKGERGSYKQWEEAGIAPQVVFEILSPSNTFQEMTRKLAFYEKYGVLEFYVYDPDRDVLEGWSRTTLRTPLTPISDVRGWVSPLLQIRFDTSGEELTIYRPDGTPFLTFAQAEAARQQAEAARQQAEAEKQVAVAAKKEAVAARREAVAAKKEAVAARKEAVVARRAAEREARRQARRAERLAAHLRSLGVVLDGAGEE